VHPRGVIHPDGFLRLTLQRTKHACTRLKVTFAQAFVGASLLAKRASPMCTKDPRASSLYGCDFAGECIFSSFLGSRRFTGVHDENRIAVQGAGEGSFRGRDSQRSRGYGRDQLPCTDRFPPAIAAPQGPLIVGASFARDPLLHGVTVMASNDSACLGFYKSVQADRPRSWFPWQYLTLCSAGGQVIAAAQPVALHLFVERAAGQLQLRHDFADVAFVLLQGAVQALGFEGFHLVGQ